MFRAGSLGDDPNHALQSSSSTDSLSSEILDTSDDEEENRDQESSDLDEEEEEQFAKCRLCPELHRIGFAEIDRLYEQNRDLSIFFIRSNAKICKCPMPRPPPSATAPAADGASVPSRKRYQQTRTHVVCLARWLRLTGDKTCPFCYCKFNCPDYIERLDTFGHFLLQNLWQVLLCATFLNLWLLRLKLTNSDSTSSVMDTTSSGSISRLPLPHYLCFIVAFMNCFVLNYFYIVYRAKRIDQSLIRFSYKRGRIETCQMFSSRMVANWYATRNTLTTNGGAISVEQQRRQLKNCTTVNYGQLYDRCSWCGAICWRSSPYHDANTDAVHYRYICGCYVYHRKCFNQCMRNQFIGSHTNWTISSPAPPARLFRRALPTCPNCGQLFRFPTRVELVLCFLRDWIIKFRCRPGSLPGSQGRPSPFRFYHGQLLQYSPSYFGYLFGTKLGFIKLATFVSVMVFYLTVEWISLHWDDPKVLQVYQLLLGLFTNSVTSNNYQSSFATNVSTNITQNSDHAPHCWSSLISLPLLWLCYQFQRLTYCSYLDDLRKYPNQLDTKFVLLDLNQYFVKQARRTP